LNTEKNKAHKLSSFKALGNPTGTLDNQALYYVGVCEGYNEKYQVDGGGDPEG
jgi:hypothetical protein